MKRMDANQHKKLTFLEVGSIYVFVNLNINQARNNLMSMKKKDLCFFYHSVSEKKIIGIVEVVKEHYPDPTDKKGRFVVVDVKAKKKLKKSVSLKKIKSKEKQ